MEMAMVHSRVISGVVLALIVTLAAPRLQAQAAVAGPDIWRSFAGRIEPGKTLEVRLTSGQRFKATLLAVSSAGLTVQPKTRLPVPPQVVAYGDIASLEIDTGKGANIGKAIAIGTAVAAGAFFGLMALTFAVWGD
jgi:hypothetical protein